MKTYKIIKEFNSKVIVECSCGSKKSIKKTKIENYSCSCIKLNELDKNERKVFSRTKNRIHSSSKDIPFGLSESHFKHVISQNCFYCDAPPRLYSDKSYANGIDRLDSDLGYTTDNVVSCCSTCNIMKGTKTYKQFREHIFKLTDELNKRDYIVTNSEEGNMHGISRREAYYFKRGVYISPLVVKDLIENGYLTQEDVKYSMRKSAWDFIDHIKEIMEFHKSKLISGLGKSAYKTIYNNKEYMRVFINSIFPK